MINKQTCITNNKKNLNQMCKYFATISLTYLKSLLKISYQILKFILQFFAKFYVTR